jgi:SOS regulatory protein LexA
LLPRLSAGSREAGIRVPDKEQRPEQPWEETIRQVRSTLERKGGGNVAAALFRVIDESFKMVTEIRHLVLTMRAESLEESTFGDWENFLVTFYEETSDLYTIHASSIAGIELQVPFESIELAASSALLQLQDMNLKKPPLQEDRLAVVNQLAKLKKNLEAARNKLESMPGVREVNDPSVEVIAREPAYVPLVGRIAAGIPILAVESVQDIFPLPRQVVGEGTHFLLEVVGDSMIEAAIINGDWVVVRQQGVAENGEIVAAMIDGDVTIKAFIRKDGHVWLLPRNESYEPIAGDGATILGKVVAVLRQA